MVLCLAALPVQCQDIGDRSMPGHGGQLLVPSREQRTIGQRRDFVVPATKGETVSALCRELRERHQIEHEWIKRFEELG
jgi:hypothetical protein